MRAAAKKRSAELRKLRRDRLFATARSAAITGNLREFYKVVRLLAPQGPKRRFQLCQGGAPLPPERELAIMQKHFEEQFASHNASLATHEPWECDDPVLVTVAEVQWHLDKLPARKAGAPSTSPGAVWRLCSDLVSPFIAQQLSDRWGQGRKCVPHLWTTATLALLLKAGKNGSEPKHFRPIGLLDALGKSCISMVLHKIKSDLEAFVRTAPQFSHIAGRSIQRMPCVVCFTIAQKPADCVRHTRVIHTSASLDFGCLPGRGASRFVLISLLPSTRFRMFWSERPCARLVSPRDRRLYSSHGSAHALATCICPD